mgnify:FL=1
MLEDNDSAYLEFSYNVNSTCFLGRIFALIEGLSLDHNESAAAREKASSTEAIIEAVLRTAVIAVFQQTSTQLFEVKLKLGLGNFGFKRLIH